MYLFIVDTKYLRPSIVGMVAENESIAEELKNILQICWHEDETQRPDFLFLKGLAKKFKRLGKLILIIN